MFRRVFVVEAVNIGEHDEQVGVDDVRYHCREAVVVAEFGDVIHFFDANRIVFVDDGDDAQGKEAGEGVAGIVEAGGVFDHVAGQQQL